MFLDESAFDEPGDIAPPVSISKYGSSGNSRPSTGNGRTMMDVEEVDDDEVSNIRSGPGASRAEALQKQRDIALKKRQASLNGGGMMRSSQDGPLMSNSPAKPTFNAQKTDALKQFSNPKKAADDVSASSEFDKTSRSQSQLPPKAKPRQVDDDDDDGRPPRSRGGDTRPSTGQSRSGRRDEFDDEPDRNSSRNNSSRSPNRNNERDNDRQSSRNKNDRDDDDRRSNSRNNNTRESDSRRDRDNYNDSSRSNSRNNRDDYDDRDNRGNSRNARDRDDSRERDPPPRRSNNNNRNNESDSDREYRDRDNRDKDRNKSSSRNNGGRSPSRNDRGRDSDNDGQWAGGGGGNSDRERERERGGGKYPKRDDDRDGSRDKKDRSPRRQQNQQRGEENEEVQAVAVEQVFTPPDYSNMRRFLTSPLPKSCGVLQCYIRRNKSGTNKIFPIYSLYLKEGDVFLMASKKRPKNKTSNYLISLDQNDLNRSGANYLGKLRSNFVGTEFQVFDNGVNPKDMEPDEVAHQADASVRCELGSVMYAANVLGSRGPRKMQVAMPGLDENNQIMKWKDGGGPLGSTNNNSSGGEGDMLTRMKDRNFRDLVYLINKPPRWNEQVGAYVLNFNGRVTMASVKNFQLVDPDEQNAVVLQFGRVGKDEFTMDLQWPISPFQAFAVTLSSFDSKIACD